MTWLNHAATGSLIAITVKNPAVALPAALLSHFVIDVVPHWDFSINGGLKQMQAARLLDLNLAFLFMIIVMLANKSQAGLICASGLLAILPDTIFLPYFLSGKKTKYKAKILETLREISLKIQISETRHGLIVELGWLIAVFIIIFIK